MSKSGKVKWKNKYSSGNLRQPYPIQLNDKALVPCLVINWSPVCLANHFIVHFEHSKDFIWTKEKTWIIIFYIAIKLKTVSHAEGEYPNQI